jgi:RNA polymerase sigma-B factor
VVDARDAGGAHRPIPLDPPREDDGYAIDAFGVEEHGYELAEQGVTLERLMTALSNRERELVRLRFAEDLTQWEIGARVGLSQMHVSRMLRQIVARLREAAEHETSAYRRPQSEGSPRTSSTPVRSPARTQRDEEVHPCLHV